MERQMKMRTTARWAAGSVMLIAASAPFAASFDTIEWTRVPGKTLTLFYPGQSTFQWLRGPEHPGAQPVTAGTACLACHNGQEQQKGAALVKGGRLEPTPPAGHDGVKQVSVQVAYDNENAYFRFQWKTKNPYPGDAYPMYRFDGKEWKLYGGPKLDKRIASGAEPPLYEDRLSMMIDDGRVPGFAAQGCWLTCHDGSRDAPKEASAAQVKDTPFFQAIRKTDVRKYLPATRTDANASWDKGVSVEQIEKLKSEGHFLDLIQWRAHRSNPVGMADDGYVLEWRNFDSGANPWSSNMDAKTKQPRYMYDVSKAGRKAFAFEDIHKAPTVLVREQNAVAFDPTAGWKEGDLLPQYVVSREDSKGSAADNKQAKGVWKDGMWTVTWVRPLNLKNPDDKSLQEGKAYNFAFAVHDDNITTRGHNVSFPMTVGFGVKANIQATKLK
jgi:hypothetical protein